MLQHAKAEQRAPHATSSASDASASRIARLGAFRGGV
jgi:hypothetical protein|tara:strand:+ start:95 stop:205 length:111 start_codon:yes stop_codon:yes gene_type:complete